MVDAGEELSVAEDAELSEFVEHMRSEVARMMGPLFGSDSAELRLASISATFVVPSDGVSASSSIDAQWFEEEEFEHGIDRYQRLTEEFASNNDLEPEDAPSQWEVVEEEFEELTEEFERAEPFLPDGEIAKGALGEEMADAVFTIHLLARMLDIDLRREFIEKANYNLEKSGQRNEDGKIIDDAGGGSDE